MKVVGFVLILLGISLLIFGTYVYFRQSDTIVSPIPDDRGVKVIYVTPSK